MNVMSFDFEDKLEITGLVLEETRTFSVDHDATFEAHRHLRHD